MKKKMIPEDLWESLDKPYCENVDKFVNYLLGTKEKLVQKLEEKGCQNINVTIDCDTEYVPYSCGEYETNLTMLARGQREETDAELEKRQKKSESAKRSAKKRKERQIKKEKETLRKLLKKYPDGP